MTTIRIRAVEIEALTRAAHRAGKHAKAFIRVARDHFERNPESGSDRIAITREAARELIGLTGQIGIADLHRKTLAALEELR